MSRGKMPDKQMMSLAPLGDADIGSHAAPEEPQASAAPAKSRIVYRGLPGNIAGIGAVAPGDERLEDQGRALDLVTRKHFEFVSESITPEINE